MDIEISQLLERVKQGARKPFWQCTPPEARGFPTLMKLLFGEPSAHVSSRDLSFASADGYQVPARLYTPAHAPQGLIVFFHGGGWVLGSVEDYHPFTSTLAHRTGCAVLSVDYRLSPEHPYPAPLEDAVAALAFAASELTRGALGTTRTLVAMGDSAGANLATVAAGLHNQRLAQPPVSLQVLAYPVVSAEFDTPSYSQFAQGHLLTAQDMRWFWDQYCPDATLRKQPDICPLHADLKFMPDTLLLTAECDPLRDEGEQYARLLQSAGNHCELIRCQGLVHAFLAMINFAPSAGTAFATIVARIQAFTGRPH